jgi:hypothetical protein
MGVRKGVIVKIALWQSWNINEFLGFVQGFPWGGETDLSIVP